MWILINAGILGGSAARWITAENALQQATRRRIHAELREHPGLYAGEIEVRLDLRRQTILYHLKVLQEVGLVNSELNGRRYYYCNDPRAEGVTWAAVGPRARLILDHMNAGLASKAELADALGISRRGVAWHLERLAKARLVTCTQRGARNLYQLVPGARWRRSPAAPDDARPDGRTEVTAHARAARPLPEARRDAVGNEGNRR